MSGPPRRLLLIGAFCIATATTMLIVSCVGPSSSSSGALSGRQTFRRRAKIVETHYVQQVAQDGSSQGSSVKSSNVANPVAAVTQPALLPREAGADYDSLAATGSSFESLAAATTDPQPADVVGSRLMEQPVRLERPVQPGLEHVDQDPSRCPVQYDRMNYDDILTGRRQPYLLGERAKPDCTNCDKDELWAHFCQFQTHGPVCPGWLKWQLASDWVERAKQGSPGMKDQLMMTPCDFFPFVRGRTLWLIGDSLTLELDKAVQCFLFEMWDLQLRDLPQLDPGYKQQGWCSHMAQGARVCFLRANNGDEMVYHVLPQLAAYGAKTSDVMVLNFAIWHNSPEVHARNISVFAKYYLQHKAELPHAIWRDSPVQHFDTGSGDYIWPPMSEDCKPLEGVVLQQDNTLLALSDEMQVLAEGGWRNKIALPVMRQLGIPIIHTWNQSLPMWQYHTNYNYFKDKVDCTHMCHPSEYQYWVFELFQTLRHVFPELAAKWTV